MKGGQENIVLNWFYCFEEKSLKRTDFSLQSKMNLLLTRSGGILGALHLFMTFEIIFPICVLSYRRITQCLSKFRDIRF